MARRSKNQDGGITFVFFAIVVVGIVVLTILLTAAVYMPVLLLVGLAIYQIKASSRRMVNEPDEPTLARLGAIERELAAYLGRWHQIKHEADVADLAVNVDGTFHRGTRLGKQLNAEKEQLGPRIDELEMAAAELRAAPLISFHKWAEVNAMRSAVLRTLLVYAVLLAGFYFVVAGPWKDLGSFTAGHVLFRTRDISDAIYGSAMLSGASSAAILFFMLRSRKASILAARSDVHQCWSDFAEFTVDPILEYQHADENVGYRTERSERGRKSTVDDRAWHEILGVSSRASTSEINAAYRAKMMKNHPDKVAELDDEFRELAESRAKLLNRARAEALRARAGTP
ncbi:J domain-containing protein [Mesorhizobium sp. LSJC264A00]|uniref:J domain-containing protein n=1 Tax=unclassified Mesorhizobium TaxID=325217 RepID=UPI0003CF4C7F|nr:J domain-containing protein [Mesorhizobium sp. LSJC264A00]ESX24174.1 hypothetical protein X767_13220 [Mesorhizobium sp. LSJC264A00]